MSKVLFQVRVGPDNFSEADELLQLRVDTSVGAVASFTGLVRQLPDDTLTALEIEHYPGMTEKVIEDLIGSAARRWPLQAARVVHRVGRLEPGENIVFVGVASRHRRAAFLACEFLIDQLKTTAPLWKKQITAESAQWLEAKTSDFDKSAAWDNPLRSDEP